jgi:hypothetical protein
MVGLFGEFLGRRIGCDSPGGGDADLRFVGTAEVGTLGDGLSGRDVVGVDGEGTGSGPGRCTIDG